MVLSSDQKDIITGVATNLIEDSINSIWEKTKVFFKTINDKESINYRKAYEKYLCNTRKKYSQIKTIIYRRAPKDLYSFYECIGVEYNGKIISTEKITDLFNLGSKLIVTGTGGIGKSILFKHLFLNTTAETSYIPVMIELRGFNSQETKDISLYDSVFKALSNNGFELSKELFEYSMREGAYVILLDGFDEVNRDRTGIISTEIKAISEKYSNNKFFVSSRPSEEFIGWNDFKEVETLSLTKTQALNLIQKIEFDETVKKVFCNELEKHLYEEYRSFASNPLLLNIMLLTFQKHAVIPERLNDFYEEAFVTLFNAHDATKDAYVRDIRSGVGCEEFKLIFSYICFKSYFSGEFEFSESRLREYINQAKDKLQKNQLKCDDYQDDLIHSVCMLLKEGLTYKFTHRSFQEYFAAWYTCKLTDDVQQKLLLNWIKESDSVNSDAYFQMLYNLQSNKVNKIVLCPVIEDVKRAYLKYNFSITLLKLLFDRLTVRKKIVDGKNTYSFSFRIKDFYLCNGIILAIRLNNYKPLNDYSKDEETAYDKLEEHFSIANKGTDYYSLKIDQALEVLSEEEFLRSVQWVKDQLLFTFEVLKKCEREKISRKRKVSAILEEL